MKSSCFYKCLDSRSIKIPKLKNCNVPVSDWQLMNRYKAPTVIRPNTIIIIKQQQNGVHRSNTTRGLCTVTARSGDRERAWGRCWVVARTKQQGEPCEGGKKPLRVPPLCAAPAAPAPFYTSCLWWDDFTTHWLRLPAFVLGQRYSIYSQHWFNPYKQTTTV